MYLAETNLSISSYMSNTISQLLNCGHLNSTKALCHTGQVCRPEHKIGREQACRRVRTHKFGALLVKSLESTKQRRLIRLNLRSDLRLPWHCAANSLFVIMKPRKTDVHLESATICAREQSE